MALVMLAASLASPAGAAEWHTNGPLELTTTNGGAMRIVNRSAGGLVLIECASTLVTLTLRGPTIPGTTVPGIGTATPIFGGPCLMSGTGGYSVQCGAAELNANSYSGGALFGTAGTGFTNGTISSIDCRLSIGATTCSTLTGQINVRYTNPPALTVPGGFGRLTLTTAGQSLTWSTIGFGCPFWPHGLATIGFPGAGSTVTDFMFAVDGPHAPWMFRTS